MHPPPHPAHQHPRTPTLNPAIRCLRSAFGYLLSAALSAVCRFVCCLPLCLLSAICYLLSAVCCLRSAVCCLLSAIRCPHSTRSACTGLIDAARRAGSRLATSAHKLSST